MVINGDSGNIGVNDDPLETIIICWPYNGGNVDNNANGDFGSNGSSGVIGTNGIIEWQCVFHILHAPLHIEINDTTGLIGAITISIIDTNGVNDDNDRHLRHWIANVANGAIDTFGANGSPKAPFFDANGENCKS